MTSRWGLLATSLLLSWLVVIGPAAAATREAQRWTPSGKWVVNFGEERCIASRPYHLAGKTMTFGIERTPMTDWFKIFLQAPGRTDNINIRSGQVRLGNRAIPIRDVLVEWSEKKDNLIYSFYVPEAELLVQGPAFDLSIKSSSLFAELPLTSISGVLKSLGQCMSSFLAHWGLSPSAQLVLAKLPEPVRPIRSYFSSSDYPRTALSRGAIGLVEGRLIVQSSGVPADCKIIRSSGHPDLDQATCSKVLKVPFKPALDRAGQPMLSPFFFSFRWLIP